MSGYDKKDVTPLPKGMNKKVIEKMKDELGSKIMMGFIGLRPKSYTYEKLDGLEDKRCKRIKKCVVRKTISFKDYEDCLFNPHGKKQYRPQMMFRSKGHDRSTVESKKVALTAMMISG